VLSVITPSGSKSARVLVKGKCSEKKGKKEQLLAGIEKTSLWVQVSQRDGSSEGAS